MRRILTLAALLWGAAATAQRLDPADYAYPVEGVSGLCSANFGELRPGHFHGGVDIKTEGVEGKRLVAAADGYVSRVTVSAGGYGRALYITMRNGKTAVYGHLQRFRDDIEEQVRSERYRRRSNAVDLRFGAGTWPVRRGDLVGFSGNSGSSMGPHLHYEIRDTESGWLHNLVREGVILPPDDTPPRIMRLHYVEVDSLDEVPLHGVRESYGVVRDSRGYRLTREEPLPVGRKGYFVLEASDRRDGVGNTFGLWRVRASVDGVPCFEYRMDGFPQPLSRCCDAVSCYPLQLVSRNEAIRLAQVEGAPALFYPLVEERGLVRTRPGEERRLVVEVEDDSGNRSTLSCTLRGRERGPRIAVDTLARPLRRGRAELLSLGGEAEAMIPAGALYESVRCRAERLEAPRTDTGLVVLSPRYRLLPAGTPLREAVHYRLRVQVPRDLRLRAMLARCTAKGALVPLGGRYEAGSVVAQSRTAGDIVAVADTLPPRIRPLFAEGADLRGSGELRFRVTDNFAGVAAWSLFIDGEWVPCDRQPVQSRLFHRFDTPPSGRRHRAVLTVTDAAGNTARLESVFCR